MVDQLTRTILQQLKGLIVKHQCALDGMLTLTIKAQDILPVAKILQRDIGFEQLTDLSGVDYATYGLDEWSGETATETGFSRGANRDCQADFAGKERFAVVYHLLSYQHNARLRLKVFLPADMPTLDSVVSIWPVADWYEREAFDLFGILFAGHPDLRRILTDYGFVGHPFRKDFPVSGEVEMRYDATKGRVVYEPVEIAERTGVAKVIRHDDRYIPDGIASKAGK